MKLVLPELVVMTQKIENVDLEKVEWPDPASVPDLDWREERKHLWDEILPLLRIAFGVLFFITLFSLFGGTLQYWVLFLAWGGLLGLMIISYIGIESKCAVLRFGEKKLVEVIKDRPHYIVQNKQENIKATVYISDEALYGKYSRKNGYRKPKVGDYLVVYYWDKRPKVAVPVISQFFKKI